MAISPKPSTFLSGVGLSGTCEITDAYYCAFDFNAKAKLQPCLAIVVKNESGQEQKPQHYPVGPLSVYAPSADGVNPNMSDEGEYLPGPFLVPLKEAINAAFGDKDFSFFMTHLVNAGFPEAKMADDIRCLIGLVAEFGPVPKKYIDDKGTEKARTVGVPLKVIKLPGEKGKGSVKAAAKTTTASAPASNGAATANHDELASKALVAALTKEGGALTVGNINPKLIAQMVNVNSKDRLQAVKRAKEPEFLNALMEAGTVLYDEGAGTVELAA